MKRTRLKRKSDRPRKWQHPEVVEAYRAANPLCEVSGLLSKEHGQSCLPCENGATILFTRRSPASDAHHITGGIHATPRWDEECNLIMLSRAVHEWIERYWQDGLCLCLTAKLRKGELDVPRLEKMLSPVRPMSLADFVGSLDLRFQQFASLREELLEGMARGQ